MTLGPLGLVDDRCRDFGTCRRNVVDRITNGLEQMPAFYFILLPLADILQRGDVLTLSIVEELFDAYVEQNLRAATSMAERQLVMAAGRIEHELTATELRSSRELQNRYLGVDA